MFSKIAFLGLLGLSSVFASPIASNSTGLESRADSSFVGYFFVGPKNKLVIGDTHISI